MSSDASVLPVHKRDTPVILWIALAVFAIVAFVLAALLYQTSHELDAQKSTVAALQLEIVKESVRTAALKSDLEAARTDAKNSSATAATLLAEVGSKAEALAAEKAKVEAVQAALDDEKTRLPELPVRIEMRRSKLGRGLVATFINTSAMQLSLMMETRNPTTLAETELALQVAPQKIKEVGHLEGVRFASGDNIRLRSHGFTERVYTVP